MDLLLKQLNSVHIFTLRFPKIHFNISHLSNASQDFSIIILYVYTWMVTNRFVSTKNETLNNTHQGDQRQKQRDQVREGTYTQTNKKEYEIMGQVQEECLWEKREEWKFVLG
jgi:hypothetical protein